MKQSHRSLLLAHTSLPVEDLDRAISFYTQAFGLEPIFIEELGLEIEQMTGVEGMRCRLAQLRVPGAEQTLELIEFTPPPNGESPGPTGVGRGHFAFAVDNLPAALARLTDIGAVPL